jgi:HK97 family phage prohead protease|tara:strand:+ start:87 stop:848 length:762 start_codon:yes stop_codon:yes gene_type:complete
MKYKQYVSKVTADADEGTVTAIISTSAIDRDKEILLPKGVNLDNFLKNPVVLFGHDFNETPIGKALWVTKGTKNIKAKVKFADTEKGSEVFNLFKGGFLNAFSVGFRATKGHLPTPDEIKKKPEWAEANWVFDEWELLEFSAVPVPANPEALALAVKSKEVSVSKELGNELDIDIEEKFFPAEASETANNKLIETVLPELQAPVIKSVRMIKTTSKIITEAVDLKKKDDMNIDGSCVAARVIKRMRGIMYMDE